MTETELATARSSLLGYEWTAANGATWVCDNVQWHGDRCAVALNDGAGRYKDSTLTSVDGIAAFIAQVQADLDAEPVADDPDEFSDIIGTEL